jgi:phosphatidylserine decarboxylase
MHRILQLHDVTPNMTQILRIDEAPASGPRLWLARLVAQEDLNFLLTNRIPRQLLTQFMGWFSQIEQPLVRRFSIAVWRFFCDVDLSDAKKMHFTSMHDCFTRELKEGARTVDPRADILTSPSDGIVGAMGRIDDTTLIQAKGFPYTLADLTGDPETVNAYRNGTYVTLRLTAGMYHRFHAPQDATLERVTYISGDTWNVNPIALKRVEKLFCKNERALLKLRLRQSGQPVMLVPVAAVLVASIRLHCLNVLLHLKYRGPNVIPCSVDMHKGEELGWFQHGSTIIVLAPEGFEVCEGVQEGSRIWMGEALLRIP